ncbi:MAG: DivIVA domain-containing protein [Thermodesulfobacteriota bacterium]
MKITPIEIKGYALKKKAFGYDTREVDSLKDLAAGALEEANREKTLLEEKIRELSEMLTHFQKNEAILKEAITTTQKMSIEIKESAKKEAELIIAEAKVRGDDIIRQSQARSTDIGKEIVGLRKQRAEFEASLSALLDYHTTKILMAEEESEKADTEANKIKYFTR